MSFTIRPFTPADYDALTGIIPTAFPGFTWDPSNMRHQDETREPHCKMGRFLAEVDGRVVATAEYSQWAGRYHPQKFGLEVIVHPQYQHQGIGTALYQRLMAELAPYDPIQVTLYTREDLPQGLAFLAKLGFVEAMRSWESILDVQAFDPSPYAGAEQVVRERGIEIRSLQELAGDPARNQKWFDLFQEARADVPAINPPSPLDRDRTLERLLNNPNFLPEGYFIAVHEGRYVGLSELTGRPGEAMLHTGLTSVRRDYRRQGIALALKLRALAYAKAVGAREVNTFNASINRPMLAINERLGFVKKPAWIDFVKNLA